MSTSTASRFPANNPQALCHCIDCKKMSGSAYSTNVITPQSGMKITKGTPKEYTMTADSGNKVVNYFCGNCGTTLYRVSPAFEGSVILKAGSLDGQDALDGLKPALELYVKERPSWIAQTQGTDEKAAMT